MTAPETSSAVMTHSATEVPFTLEVNGRVVYQPTPKQLQFHLCPARYVLFGGAVAGGKAVDSNEVVPTPAGWTTMGTLREGDEVFGANGRPTRVTHAWPVQLDRDCYRVTFDDGASVVVDGDHLWHTYTLADREALTRRTHEFREKRRLRRPLRGTGKRPDLVLRNRETTPKLLSAPTGAVSTTTEIAASLVARGRQSNHSVQICGAWELEAQLLPLDPYVLGVWLGDGSRDAGYITTADEEIVSHLQASGFDARKLSAPYLWSFSGLRKALQVAGVFRNKHVPASYLRGSVAQRQALLEGLMDTDGCAEQDGQVGFANTNRQLADSVFELAISLGHKPTLRDRPAKLNGKACGTVWEVKWTPDRPVFRLSRKLARQKATVSGVQRWRYIASVDRVPSVPVRCITVAAPDGLFLIGKHAIPTHNSHALRWHGYMSCLSVPNFKVLLLRRHLTELERTHCRRVAEEQHQFGAKWNKSEFMLYFPNGSFMELGHCQHEDDANTYLSAEYDLILFDELVTFSETQYRKIRSRCRTTIPGVTPRVMAGTNPGGNESAWVRRMWVEKDLTTEEDPYYNPADYAYIPARLEDNPHINREAYELELQGLPPELARAYREGDWDIFYGQYFQEFRKSIHVADLGNAAPHARRICGLDYGYSREGVCLWGVMLPEGQLYIEDEYTFNGHRRKKQIASEVARSLRKRSDERGIVVGGCFADPDIFNPSGHTGETIAETFARYGWPMISADNDRINGWARVRAWLGSMPRHESWDGDRPWMVINPKCIGLVRTLPQMVMDQRRPEDCNTEGPDHWCLYGDTLILTKNGSRAISTLGLTDEVMTRYGWRAIEAVAVTSRDAPLIRLLFSNGSELVGTGTHPVWTQNRGLVRMDALRYDDIISTWETHSVTITERLANSGAPRMVLFLRATRFIIGTTIPQITSSRTWSACRSFNTALITRNSRSQIRRIWQRYGPWLQSGTAPLLAESGIGNMVCALGQLGPGSKRTVPSAVLPTMTSRVGPQLDSVQTTASQCGVGPLARMLRDARAKCAAICSWLIGSCPPNAARASAVRVVASFPAGTGTVYNLTVQDNHEYFANGILVSNCDALRYLVMSRPAPNAIDRPDPIYPEGSMGWMKQQILSGRSQQQKRLGERAVRRYAY